MEEQHQGRIAGGKHGEGTDMPYPAHQQRRDQAAGDEAGEVGGAGKANLGRSKTNELGAQGQQGQLQAVTNQQQCVRQQEGCDGNQHSSHAAKVSLNALARQSRRPCKSRALRCWCYSPASISARRSPARMPGSP